MATSRSLSRDLWHMLRDLTGLAATADGRKLLADNLERTLSRSTIGADMLGKIRKMYAFFRDPKAPLKPKLLIGAALLYFVIPTDLIPDFIPMLGLTDDLAALMMIWKQVSYVLNTYQTPQPVLDGEEIIGEEIT